MGLSILGIPDSGISDTPFPSTETTWSSAYLETQFQENENADVSSDAVGPNLLNVNNIPVFDDQSGKRIGLSNVYINPTTRDMTNVNLINGVDITTLTAEDPDIIKGTAIVSNPANVNRIPIFSNSAAREVVTSSISVASGNNLTGVGSINNINMSSSDICLLTEPQILTFKTIDSDYNTITNIANADIKTGAAIDASKIADGSVSNTEFQYINSLTSNAQSQITNHVTNTANPHSTTIDQVTSSLAIQPGDILIGTAPNTVTKISKPIDSAVTDYVLTIKNNQVVYTKETDLAPGGGNQSVKRDYWNYMSIPGSTVELFRLDLTAANSPMLFTVNVKMYNQNADSYYEDVVIQKSGLPGSYTYTIISDSVLRNNTTMTKSFSFGVMIWFIDNSKYNNGEMTYSALSLSNVSSTPSTVLNNDYPQIFSPMLFLDSKDQTKLVKSGVNITQWLDKTTDANVFNNQAAPITQSVSDQGLFFANDVTVRYLRADYNASKDIFQNYGSYFFYCVRVKMDVSNHTIINQNATDGWNVKVFSDSSIRFRVNNQVLTTAPAGLTTLFNRKVTIALFFNSITNSVDVWVDQTLHAQFTGFTHEFQNTTHNMMIGVTQDDLTEQFKGNLYEVILGNNNQFISTQNVKNVIHYLSLKYPE